MLTMMTHYHEVAQRAVDLFKALGGADVVDMKSGGSVSFLLHLRHVPIVICVDGRGYSCSDGRAFDDAAFAVLAAADGMREQIEKMQSSLSYMLDMADMLKRGSGV